MGASVRRVQRRFPGAETLEGAGVRLRRMFGGQEVPLLDPFLLLDNFGSSNPADYLAGFPWHPHRGIDTVTYMLNGSTDHEDSLGNRGTIGSGEIQWMSSGHGILHQEMPQRTEGRLSGFQLWVNLPHAQKLQTPAYRGVGRSEIPVVHGGDGREVRVIAGTFEGVRGAVEGIPVDPLYLDVRLPAEAEFRLPVPLGHTVFAQLIEGTAEVEPAPPGARSDGAPPDRTAAPGETILYGDGDLVEVRSGPAGARFLVGAGRPLHEPVAWYGPIVMNTNDEIRQAIADLRSGTFVRDPRVVVEE